MTLLELLVQELPKRGGWPVGTEIICSHGNGHVYAYVTKGRTSGRQLPIYGCNGQTVTREQYEVALAKTEWNGEGLPPVGCEFEYGTHRTRAKCLEVGHHMIFASKGNPDDEDGDFEEFMISIRDSEFHPIRSKRDEIAAAIKDIFYTLGEDGNYLRGAGVYDAIAAGKIPGLKLSD